MLNTKLTIVSYPHILKKSLGSSKCGLSNGLNDFEVRLQIYTLILFCFHDRSYGKRALFYSQRFESNNFKDFGRLMVLNWKLSFDKKKYPKTIYFTTTIQNHCIQITWIDNELMCKFWFWPWLTSEAVSEAILAWSQWNLQDMRVRYKT